MRVFGFGGRKRNAGSGHSPENPAGNPPRGRLPGHEARAGLLERISEFFLRHGLDIGPRNLSIAHAAFSGSSLGLARKIAAAQTLGPITQEWLDEAVAGDPAFATDEADGMRARMDHSLQAMSETARRATEATGDYGAALTLSADRMAGARENREGIPELVELTRAMIERTREIEAEMHRSRQEAECLRVSLANARRDADLDHLTGLPNRRAFEAVYEREYREARAALECLSIAICDIDRFKSINDTYGHATGDRVIKAIGEALAAISSDRCHVARHGGEEFVLLFRGLMSEAAAARLEHIRETFGRRRFVKRENDEPIGHITFSAGVANVFAFDNPRAALHAADEALYRAKEAGRNRIVVACGISPQG